MNDGIRQEFELRRIVSVTEQVLPVCCNVVRTDDSFQAGDNSLIKHLVSSFDDLIINLFDVI